MGKHPQAIALVAAAIATIATWGAPASAASPGAAANPAATAPKPPRPNVLFIAVDDLDDWVGFLGGCPGKVHTPHMDRLAASGTAFTNAHTAAPVCCPSRAAVMSGLLPSTSGVYNNQQWWKPHRPDLVTIPAHFRAHGYTAVGAGKVFHHTVGNNPPNVWDDFQRLIFNDDGWHRAGTKLYPFTKQQPKPDGFPLAGIKTYSHEADWGVLDKPEHAFDDFATASYAVDFLARHPRGKPFFLACGIFRPHMPWYIPKKYLDRYPADRVVLPETPEDDLDDVPAIARKMALKKASDLKRIREANKWRTAVAHYLASITFADAQVGRVIDALKKSQHAGNTVVVLWSDHGWHLGEKGHWHKRTLWEEATRVPLIIAAPGVGKPGQRCARPTDLTDLFPTLIKLCSLPAVDGLDGQSLVPLMRNPTANRARPAITIHEGKHAAARGDRFRYIRYADGAEELYDHATDPNEWTNRAADPTLAGVKRRLAAYLPKRWAPDAARKTAYHFDPKSYSWTHKKTGKIIRGQ